PPAGRGSPRDARAGSRRRARQGSGAPAPRSARATTHGPSPAKQRVRPRDRRPGGKEPAPSASDQVGRESGRPERFRGGTPVAIVLLSLSFKPGHFPDLPVDDPTGGLGDWGTGGSF